MKLNLKEDPREWRKAAMFSALGLSVLSTVLHWRKLLPTPAWLSALAFLAVVVLAALVCPRWFRLYYRGASRIGFYVSSFVGRVLMVLLFLLLVTPMGLVLRLLGKDALRLKRSPNSSTYWLPAKEPSPLDRLF